MKAACIDNSSNDKGVDIASSVDAFAKCVFSVQTVCLKPLLSIGRL
jgi:hypothetical protein